MSERLSQIRSGTVDAPAAPTARRAGAPARAGAPPDGRAQRLTAVVLATAQAHDGGPAAALPCGDQTLIGRLLAQLVELGVAGAEVITRPAWEPLIREAIRGAGVDVAVRTSRDAPEDLRLVAEVARARRGSIVIGWGHVLVHRQALARLLSDTRVFTAILARHGAPEETTAVPTRTSRGRLIGAASAYHSVSEPTASFLGVLRVSARDRLQLAETAERLRELVTPPLPPDWEAELARKTRVWSDDGDAPEAWAEQASDDVASLLVVGLVRGGIHVTSAYVRLFFWASPLSRAEARAATQEIEAPDQDSLQLESAVKGADGFFTTFFVSPYSRYIARWAARRGFAPNQVTAFSMAIGLGAAAAFATGSRLGLVAGAVLLHLSFTFDCVDGQLARYTRNFSNLGGWLDSILDRAKEYAVFAGLALGSVHGFHDDVWVLATAALVVQTTRHFSDFSFGSAQRAASAAARHPPLEQSSDEPEQEVAGGGALRAWLGAAMNQRVAAATRRALAPYAARILERSKELNEHRWVIWVKRIIMFPIGERFATIALTAAIWQPRVTFIALLAWGAFAGLYALAARVARGILA